MVVCSEVYLFSAAATNSRVKYCFADGFPTQLLLEQWRQIRKPEVLKKSLAPNTGLPGGGAVLEWSSVLSTSVCCLTCISLEQLSLG